MFPGSNRTPHRLFQRPESCKAIAKALHGIWLAPAQGFDDPDAILLVGINPFVSYTGLPAGRRAEYFNVYPAEVEKVLYALPEVAEAAVVGVQDDRWGEHVTAFIVLRDGAELTCDAVARHCRSSLAS